MVNAKRRTLRNAAKAFRKTSRNGAKAFRKTAWRTVGWAAVAAVVVIPRPSAAQQSAAALGADLSAVAPSAKAEAPSAKAAPVFTKDVAPILQEKCQACHRPGYIAPMAFMTFEETRPWARSIKSRVAARQMPPWHIDKAVGIQHFKNDRSLSDKEIDTIVRWVDAGAPKGDPKDMPPPKTFARDDVWNFAELYGGPPDLIVKSPAYTTPAQALDQWFKPVVETGLTETRWVRAIEIRPVNREGPEGHASCAGPVAAGRSRSEPHL